MLERSSAAASSDVEDVTDPTLPDKWKYAAYFNHMKKEVYRAWDPISVYRQLPTGMTRNLPPTVTIVLHVKLAPEGARPYRGARPSCVSAIAKHSNVQRRLQESGSETKAEGLGWWW